MAASGLARLEEVVPFSRLGPTMHALRRGETVAHEDTWVETTHPSRSNG